MLTHQVYDPGGGQPHGYEDGNELGQPVQKYIKQHCFPASEISSPCFFYKPDGGGRLEYVQVLQDVRDCHEPERPQEPEPDPGPVQVDGHEGRGDGEVVHEGVQLKHKPELVARGDELLEFQKKVKAIVGN